MSGFLNEISFSLSRLINSFILEFYSNWPDKDSSIMFFSTVFWKFQTSPFYSYSDTMSHLSYLWKAKLKMMDKYPYRKIENVLWILKFRSAITYPQVCSVNTSEILNSWPSRTVGQLLTMEGNNFSNTCYKLYWVMYCVCNRQALIVLNLFSRMTAVMICFCFVIHPLYP